MLKHTETVCLKDVRDVSNIHDWMERKRTELVSIFGFGMMSTEIIPDGDIRIEYSYSKHLAKGLSQLEVEAIYHARVLMCNIGGVRFDRKIKAYVSTGTHEDDPAFEDRLVHINALEELAPRYGKPTV